MVVLIDTNIIIDFLCKRPEFYDEAELIMTDLASDDMEGYLAFHTVSNLWYIMRNTPVPKRRKLIRTILSLLTVSSASHSDVEKAIENESFNDFEDCLQEACAKNANADFIVTRNADDFKQSQIPVILPEEYIKLRDLKK